MKNLFLIVASCALASQTSTVFARVGETEAQIEARYGKSIADTAKVKPDLRDDLGNPIRFYFFRDFTITVSFVNGRSASELFAKFKNHIPSDQWETMTEDEVDAILAAYKDSGVKWKRADEFAAAGQRPLSWKSDDGRLKAVNMMNKVLIANATYLEQSEAQRKQLAKQKLEGL